MEASCYCPIKTLNFCSSLPTPKPKISSFPSQPFHTHQLRFPLPNSASGRPRNWRPLAVAVGCAKGGPVAELEEEVKDIISGLDEWGGIVGERWREKCEEEGGGGGGEGGIVEMMECLEREAIMGEDEGREPTDYNRRALIFDKSSRVFQALKERDAQKSS